MGPRAAPLELEMAVEAAAGLEPEKELLHDLKSFGLMLGLEVPAACKRFVVGELE